MDFNDILTTIGLSDKEASIYLALVRSGEQRVSSLSRETGIHRPGLYALLPEMVSRGLLVESTQNKSTYYEAVSPTLLEKHYLKKQGLIQRGLSELEELHAHKHEKPTVKFLEGVTGINFVFNDLVTSLPRGAQYYRYTSKTTPTVESGSYYEIGTKKKLEQLVITSEKKKARKKDRLDRFTRGIPTSLDSFEDNIMFLIYGSKIALVDYESKNSFIIESEKIAKFQEKLFRLLWKKLK